MNKLVRQLLQKGAFNKHWYFKWLPGSLPDPQKAITSSNGNIVTAEAIFKEVEQLNHLMYHTFFVNDIEAAFSN